MCRFFFLGRRCTGVGPIFDPSLDKDDPASAPVGSLVFFNAATDEEARETVENDPLNEAGLFESMFIARLVLAYGWYCRDVDRAFYSAVVCNKTPSRLHKPSVERNGVSLRAGQIMAFCYLLAREEVLVRYIRSLS